MLETDLVSLKHAVSSEADDLSALGVVFRKIKFQLRVCVSDLCINYCPRSCNQVAHTLVTHGTPLDMGTCEIWLDQFSNFVSNGLVQQCYIMECNVFLSLYLSLFSISCTPPSQHLVVAKFSSERRRRVTDGATCSYAGAMPPPQLGDIVRRIYLFWRCLIREI